MEFSCIIVGNKQTGKSTFLRRWLDGNYVSNYTPTTELIQYDLVFHTTRGKVTLKIQDGGYCKAPDCALIFQDLTSKDNNIPVYVNWLKANFGKIPTIVCGNKCDIIGTQKPGKLYADSAKEAGLLYFSISAKSNYNFEKPFIYLIRLLTTDCKDYPSLSNCGVNLLE